jgi:divalent metal cation (Fe/Co/Zn/Cd) transporter
VLVRRSALGLLDRAVSIEARDAIRAVFARHESDGIAFHALRTRQAAGRSFVSVHVLVPGAWTVQQGHDLVESIEGEIRAVVPGASVLTHLEPAEDPASLLDADLDR